jgi:hypothetical protein
MLTRILLLQTQLLLTVNATHCAFQDGNLTHLIILLQKLLMKLYQVKRSMNAVDEAVQAELTDNASNYGEPFTGSHVKVRNLCEYYHDHLLLILHAVQDRGQEGQQER